MTNDSFTLESLRLYMIYRQLGRQSNLSAVETCLGRNVLCQIISTINFNQLGCLRGIDEVYIKSMQ